MNLNRLLFSTFYMITICGCAAKPYIPPERSGNAVLDFSSAGGIMGFRFYENASNCTGDLTLAEENDPLKNPSKTMVLHANRPVAFEFIWLLSDLPLIKTCSVLLSFSPEANGEYAVKGSIDKEFCYMKMVDLKNGSAPVGPKVELKQMKYVPSIGIRNQCAALD